MGSQDTGLSVGSQDTGPSAAPTAAGSGEPLAAAAAAVAGASKEDHAGDGCQTAGLAAVAPSEKATAAVAVVAAAVAVVAVAVESAVHHDLLGQTKKWYGCCGQ